MLAENTHIGEPGSFLVVFSPYKSRSLATINKSPQRRHELIYPGRNGTREILRFFDNNLLTTSEAGDT